MRPIAVEHTSLTPLRRDQLELLLDILGDCWVTNDGEALDATYLWLRTGEH